MDMEKVKKYVENGAATRGLFLDQCRLYDGDPDYLKVISYVNCKKMTFKIMNKDNRAELEDIKPLIDNKLEEMVHIRDKNKTRKF